MMAIWTKVITVDEQRIFFFHLLNGETGQNDL